MATTNDDNNIRCDPCSYCQHAWSKAATRYEPEDSGCKAEDDPRMDGWEPNMTTPCPCFKPFLASDNLYKELQYETEFAWHLQETYESCFDYDQTTFAHHIKELGEDKVCKMLGELWKPDEYKLRYELALARYLVSLRDSQFLSDDEEYRRLIGLHGIGNVRRILTYIGEKI